MPDLQLDLIDTVFRCADWVVRDCRVPTYLRSTLEAICRDDALGLIEAHIHLTCPSTGALHSDPRYVLARVRYHISYPR